MLYFFPLLFKVSTQSNLFILIYNACCNEPVTKTPGNSKANEGN